MNLIFGILLFLTFIKQEIKDYQNTTISKEIELKANNPSVLFKKITGNPCSLFLYFPNRLKIHLCQSRPNKSEANYLCVPAAFTQLKSNQIDGLFVAEGQQINSQINTTLTGACILSSEKIEIIELKQITPDLKDEIIKNKKSLFQQTLLVENDQAYPYKTLPKNKFKRRALLQIDGKFCVAESEKAISIAEFQNLLVSIGTTNAIYLDMGSWSEGWYRNPKNQIVTIGENMSNTKRQSNWIVFSIH